LRNLTLVGLHTCTCAAAKIDDTHSDYLWFRILIAWGLTIASTIAKLMGPEVVQKIAEIGAVISLFPIAMLIGWSFFTVTTHYSAALFVHSPRVRAMPTNVARTDSSLTTSFSGDPFLRYACGRSGGSASPACVR
jgi:amino acid transporter